MIDELDNLIEAEKLFRTKSHEYENKAELFKEKSDLILQKILRYKKAVTSGKITTLNV